MKSHPSQPSDIVAGQEVVVLTRYDNGNSGATRLHFEGRTANGPIHWTSRVVFPASSRENSFIARLWATQRVGYLSAEKRRHGGSSEVDDEIRQLGEQYGIPTEFSSYLVLEPGMDPRRRVGNAPMQLGNVVTSGAASPPPAPMPMSVQVFEDARKSAAQRSATSLSAADAVDKELARNEGGAQRAGKRLFALRDSVWTDIALKDSMRRVKIKSYSAAYFAILDALPELREPLALGDRVVVAGREIAIEIAPSGVEKLSDREIQDLQSKW
jgi:hypothetical protein